jgi:hypothetical protein
MAVDNKLFTVAGITTHRGVTRGGVVVERTKVRFGTDMIRLVKMLNSPKKVWDRPNDIGLAPVRLDLADLPQALTKLDALQYLAGNESFQGADDQFLIREELVDRQKRAAREAKRATLTVNAGKLIHAAKAKAPVTA